MPPPSAFDEAFARVKQLEGGYTNDPDDSGGETNFGITLATARAFGYVLPMRDMTRENAKAIYRARYWSAQQLDAVALLSRAVALEVFDTSVNMGTTAAGRFLQRALNVLNDGATLYRDVEVDGRIGAISVACLRSYIVHRGAEGEAVLLAALNALQGAAYIELAENRPKDERFAYGWLRSRVLRVA